MTTYKINGKEIKLELSTNHNGGKYIDMVDVQSTLLDLLEALSDKEESKLGSFAGQFCGKNIYFECEDKKIWDNFQKALQSKSFLFEEPKQKQCNHRSYNSNQKECKDCGKDPYSETKQSTSLKSEIIEILRSCERYLDDQEYSERGDQVINLFQSHLVKENGKVEKFVEPKQSTSLKEEIYQILDNHFGGFETFNNNIPTEQIISLLQSYLLKEIEDKDFAAVNRHCFDGRVVDLEDIIKIINNITDQNERNN